MLYHPSRSKKVMEKTHPASLLTRGLVKKFAQEMEKVLIQTNTGKTPFIMFLAILSMLVNYQGELVQIVEWENTPPLAFINKTA